MIVDTVADGSEAVLVVDGGEEPEGEDDDSARAVGLETDIDDDVHGTTVVLVL